MQRLVIIILTTLIGTFALAQNEGSEQFGGDAFMAGNSPVHSATGIDDLFMAGELVTSEADITGTAHLAGRRVTLDGSVGGDVYAAGMDVFVHGPVGGDATLAGYSVDVTGDVGGDVRATGSSVSVSGNVSGNALLGGETLRIDGKISGDVSIGAGTTEFGPGARIAGTLIYYAEDPDNVDIPSHVASSSQIEIRHMEQWEEDGFSIKPSTGSIVLSSIGWTLCITVVALLLILIAPNKVARLRERTFDRPFRAVWIGFLGLSTLIGSIIVFAMTLIGIVVSPLALLLAILTGMFGYVIGIYVFGVAVLGLIGRPEPVNFGQKAIAAVVGAVLAGLLVLIPFLGWLFALALSLIGAGAILISMFRPGFFTEQAA